MDFNKLTLKSQEAVAAAQELARRSGNPELYPEHLTQALLDQELPQQLVPDPAALRAQAEACENVGCWPVLVGEEGDGSTLLCSPIILGDYPEIAPESPGDLFDGGEIDQLLILNILSLTDEEKREMRDSDPRAREILERTEALSEDELMRLHAGRHS